MQVKKYLALLGAIFYSSLLWAEEPSVEAVLQARADMQRRVKTVQCSATVETIYPKGGLSRLSKHVFPEKDERYTNQWVEWSLDFASNRASKEYRLMRPWYGPKDDCELSMEHTNLYFYDGKFRIFHNREDYAGRKIKYGPTHDVTLHEERAQDLMFWFGDLPLVAMGGWLSKDLPLPAFLRLIDPPSTFKLLNRANWKDVECLVLQTVEQNDPTSTREFWIDANQMNRIIRIASFDNAKKVIWDVQVLEYRDIDHEAVPWRWVFHQFNYPSGEAESTMKFQMKQAAVNVSFRDGTFNPPLQPGMIAHHNGTEGFLTVDAQGNVIIPGKSRNGFQWGWGTVLIGLCVTFFIVLLVVGLVRRLSLSSRG